MNRDFSVKIINCKRYNYKFKNQFLNNSQFLSLVKEKRLNKIYDFQFEQNILQISFRK